MARRIFEIALGLGVEVEVEQDIDVRTGAVAQRLEVHDEIAQDLALDVELGREGRRRNPAASRADSFAPTRR